MHEETQYGHKTDNWLFVRHELFEYMQSLEFRSSYHVGACIKEFYIVVQPSPTTYTRCNTRFLYFPQPVNTFFFLIINFMGEVL